MDAEKPAHRTQNVIIIKADGLPCPIGFLGPSAQARRTIDAHGMLVNPHSLEEPPGKLVSIFICASAVKFLLQ
jgi:hypothetical protein